MRPWLLTALMVGLFSPAISFGQDVPKADTDAVVKTETAKPETFSFRGIKFGSSANEISGLVKSKDAHNDPMVWYVRKDEKPINNVRVKILYGFYKKKLTKIVITSQGQSENHKAIDEALRKKYGNPQDSSEISKTQIAKLWGRHMAITTKNGLWEELFPLRPSSGRDMKGRRILTTGELWWFLNDRVLMRNEDLGVGACIEIKDVPLLIEAMKSAEQEYKEQVNKAADKAAKNDF